MDEAMLSAARTVVDTLVEEADLLELTEELARYAGDLAEAHRLRAYDAVHLASADVVADADTVLVAADGELLTAACALGIATAPV